MRISLNDVSFSYRERNGRTTKALSNVSLTVGQGDCVGVIGREGAGKSTLLFLLDALLKPDHGLVEIDGRDIWSRPADLPDIRKRIGFAFQFPEDQFLHEQVSEELAAMGVGSDAGGVLGRVGLDEAILGRSVDSLSVGEARRVALVSLCVRAHELLLLDEPTAGIDGDGRECLEEILFQQMRDGVSVVIVTHDLDLLCEFASNVVLLEKETAALQGVPSNLFMKEDLLSSYGYELPETVRLIGELFSQGRLEENRFLHPSVLRDLLSNNGSGGKQD